MHRLNVYSTTQSDLPGNFTEKDMRYKRTRRRGARKYLRKSCYYCIECPATNFLVAFMWKRPLNSAALATTTHKTPERVFDETNTQVLAQMINKCRIKIVERELYNVRDLPWIRDPTIKKIAISDGQSLSQQHKKPSPISSADGKKPLTSISKSLVSNTILLTRLSLTLIFDRKKPS